MHYIQSTNDLPQQMQIMFFITLEQQVDGVKRYDSTQMQMEYEEL